MVSLINVLPRRHPQEAEHGKKCVGWSVQVLGSVQDLLYRPLLEPFLQLEQADTQVVPGGLRPQELHRLEAHQGSDRLKVRPPAGIKGRGCVGGTAVNTAGVFSRSNTNTCRSARRKRACLPRRSIDCIEYEADVGASVGTAGRCSPKPPSPASAPIFSVARTIYCDREFVHRLLELAARPGGAASQPRLRRSVSSCPLRSRLRSPGFPPLRPRSPAATVTLPLCWPPWTPHQATVAHRPPPVPWVR